MPMMLTPAVLDATFWGFDLTFQQALKSQPTVWQKIASLKPSGGEQEVYAWMDLLPELRKWYGERVINRLKARAQVLVNDPYELTIGVDRKKIEDDKIGIYTDYIAQMGASSALWPEKLTIDALTNGNTVTVYDNQYFFDVDHPINLDDPNSATQSNSFDYSASGGLTSDNLADARAKMRSLKGVNNQSLEVNPNILLCSPTDEYVARKLLNSEVIAVTQGSGAAAVDNQLKGTMDVVSSGRLAGSDSVYLLDCTGPVRPLIFQQRDPAQFTFLNKPEDPNVFLRDEYLFGIRARGAGGYGPWWKAAKMKIR